MSHDRPRRRRTIGNAAAIAVLLASPEPLAWASRARVCHDCGEYLYEAAAIRCRCSHRKPGIETR